MRGYFLGVTIVAAWSALIVGVGALLLGVPLAGTIAVVTFLGGYVPYLGAWTGGGFAVLIALGGQGPEAAVAMAVIVLLANGVLQQLVQPIAYGAALKLHPLAVLIATIAGGCLFGTVGLVLAAPLLSAAVKISADLTAAVEAEEEDRGPLLARLLFLPAGGQLVDDRHVEDDHQERPQRRGGEPDDLRDGVDHHEEDRRPAGPPGARRRGRARWRR